MSRDKSAGYAALAMNDIKRWISECSKPGGCGPRCRQALARGDDMQRYWPNGGPYALPEDWDEEN